MKKHMLLALLCFSTMLTACAPAAAPVQPDKKSVKIFLIGNSYTGIYAKYLWDILHSAGYEEVTVGASIVYDGALVHQATDFDKAPVSYTISEHERTRTYRKFTSSEPVEKTDVSLKAMIADEPWDYILLQDGSTALYDYEHYFGTARSDSKYAFDMAQFIEDIETASTNPNRKLGFTLPWSRSDEKLASVNRTKDETEKAYKETVGKLVKEFKLDFTVDLMTPVNEARMDPVLSKLPDPRKPELQFTRDGSHLCYGIGNYLASYAIAHGICGIGADATEWYPADLEKPEKSNTGKVTAETAALARACACKQSAVGEST